MKKIDEEMKEAIEIIKANYKQKEEEKFEISEEQKLVQIINEQMLQDFNNEDKIFNKHCKEAIKVKKNCKRYCKNLKH